MANSQCYGTNAVLSSWMYVFYGSDQVHGRTLNEIVEGIQTEHIRPADSFLNTSGYQDQLDRLILATQNYNIGDLRIIDTSWNSDHDGNYDTRFARMNAATFMCESSRSLHIAYRGTGDGNWSYNATSAFGDGSSNMQSTAIAYLDRTIEMAISRHGSDLNISLTGHSQGGNNAEYGLMFSRFSDMIGAVYTFDAPGHNLVTIDRARAQNPNFEAMRELIFAFNGQNDPVHVLGEYRLPLNHNSFYVYSALDSIKDVHCLFARFNEYGEFTARYENEILTCAGQGPIAGLASDLNANILRLPSDTRYEAARTIMDIVNTVVTEAIDSSDVTIRELGTVLRTLPLAITHTVLADTSQFFGVLHELGVPPLLTTLVAVNPQGALILTLWITTVAVSTGVRIELLHQLIDFMSDIARTAGALLSKGGQLLLNTLDSFKGTINNFAQWLGNIAANRRSFAGGFVGSGDFTLRFDRLNDAHQNFRSVSNGLNDSSDSLRAAASRLSGQTGFGIPSIQRSINNLARDLSRLGVDVSSIAGFITLLNETTQNYENMAFNELASGAD